MIWKKLYMTTIYIFILAIAFLGILITETNHKKNVERFVALSINKEISELNELELVGNTETFINQGATVNYDALRSYMAKVKLEDNEQVAHYQNSQFIFASISIDNFQVDQFEFSLPEELNYVVKEKPDYELVITSKFVFGSYVYDRVKIINIEDLFESRFQNYQFLLAFSFISLVFIGLIYYKLSKNMIAPLDEVVSHLAFIGDGDYSKELKIEQNHDYDQIVNAVNQMQENVMEASETLKEQNRRQSLFIRNMNHEIRTPVTSLVGYADLLCHDKLNAAMKEEALAFIKTEGRRLTDLSKKLSTMLFVSDYVVNNVEINSKELMRHLQSMYQHHSRFGELYFDFEDFDLYIDVDLLYMFYFNVIDNSIKATYIGEKIIIQMKKEKDLVCRVIDYGIGFDFDLKNDVYEPFVKGRYKKESDGTGLGLSICKNVANLLKGSICIEQNEPKGTIVSMIIKGGNLC